MKSILPIFASALTFLVPPVMAQITIDGNFSDWNGVPAYVTNTTPDTVWGPNGTFTAGYYVAGADSLYIRTEVAGVFHPIDWDHYYIIYIDADTSTSTGLTNGWWTMGADYRIVIDSSAQYLQRFMGANQFDDAWGWGGRLNDEHAIDAAYSGNSCELAVAYSDVSLNLGSAIWLQWRAEPGTNAMPAFNASPRTAVNIGPAPSSIVQDSLKVLVPAYFSPSASNYWLRMDSVAAKMPGRLWAIANVYNGPGSAYDASYATVIKNLQASGGKVIGYVHTSYGQRPISTVEADIDAWYSYYPSLNGIFIDEQANTSGEESYYAQLYNYIKQKDSTALVATNPGANTLESYLFYNGNRIADVICVFEDGIGFSSWAPSSWYTKYNRSNFYVIPYNTSVSNFVSVVDRAASLNMGWIYCTDATLPNPYGVLPSYFEGFCNYILTGIDTATSSGTGGGGTGGGATGSLPVIDWNKLPALNSPPNPAASSTEDPDAQFTHLWAANNDTDLFLSYQVAGTINFPEYYYHIFIDTDNDSLGHQTGYVYDTSSIGAEFMVEDDLFYKYTGTGGADWSWAPASGMVKVDTTGWTGLSIPLSTLFPNGGGKSVGLVFETNLVASPYSMVSIAPDSFHTEKYLYVLNSVSGVKQFGLSNPTSFSLGQNYPNPFNPTTEIEYTVPERSFVRIVVYNVLGQLVSTLVEGVENPGRYETMFSGTGLASGVYLCLLQSGRYMQVRKMMLLK